MAVTIKPITLWRNEVQDRPGALAEVLEPLAAAKADLQVVMGYKVPGEKARAVLEVWPVSGRKLSVAAEGAGLTPSRTPTLLVSGDNRPGLGHAIARSMADSGINLSFLVAQVAGRKYSAVLGFENADDAAKAAGLIRKAVAARRRR
jgi:hypothetical protein